MKLIIAAVSNTTITAAVATAAGALIVGIIAAWTAGVRQKRDLKAEEVRLEMQLRSGREIRERDHLRTVLDEALTAGRVRHEQFRDIWRRNEYGVVAVERTRAEHAGEISVQFNRLTLRLGRGHEVVVAYGMFRDAMSRMVDLLMAALRPGETAENRSDLLTPANRNVLKALDDFIDKAVALAGTPPTV